MKRSLYNFLFSVFFLLFSLPVAGQEDTDTIGYVVYADSVSTPIVNLQERHYSEKKRDSQETTITSRKGKLSASYHVDDDTEMTDGMLRCLKVAMDLWEEHIQINSSVLFDVNLTYDIEPYFEIKTTVCYSRLGRWNSRAFSLYSQDHSGGIIKSSICINANVNWDYSWMEDIDGGNDNLITALLRHIGHILGFGSSITELNGQTGFAINRCASDFDNLIVNSQGVSLGSIAINSNSSTISSFLAGNLFLSLPSASFSLYSNHNETEPYRDGKYFSLTTDNIMNYPYGDRSQLMTINSETLDALEAIGWETMPHDMTISGTDLDEIGYGSTYKSHTFSIRDSNGLPQTALWKYQVFINSSQQYSDVATGNGSAFTLGNTGIVSSAIDDYQCMQGRIVCQPSNGDSTSEYVMPLFLELKPDFIGYEILNVNTATGTYFYSFDLKLTHLGTSQGFLSVNNEYGLTSSYTFTGDGETMIHVGNAFKYGQTYLYLTLRNEYGDNVKTIYLDNPYNSLQNLRSEGSGPYITAFVNDSPTAENSVIQHGDSLDLAISGLDNNENLKYGFKWELMLRNGDEIVWSKTLNSTGETCSFKMLPQLFRKSIYDLSFERTDNKIRVQNEKGNKYYYYGVIKASIKENDRWKRFLYYPIIIDVLPEKPAIRLLKYEEVTDEWTDIPYPVAYVEIDAPGFLYGHFFTTQGTWFGAPGLHFEQGTPMPLQVEIDWGSYNCGYGCTVLNEYGVVSSDTIFPDRSTVNVPHKTQPQVSIEQSGRTLSVKSPYPLDEISVISLSGNICLSKKETAKLSVNLSPGIYVIRFNRGHEKSVKKIIVK